MPSLEHNQMVGQELTPEEYIRENFEPSDRIAVLVLNRKSGQRVQRVVTAQALASESWQRWLRAENAHGADIYISQNALRENTRNRKKEDIAAIRHVYLDLNTECPQCGSMEFKKVSLVYAEGLSHLNAHSRGWGLVAGSGGADLGFGKFRTRGEIQSRLSQKVSPPRKWSYWKILFGGLIGLLVLEFILGYADTFLRAGGNFNQQLAWFGYSYLGAVAIIICFAVRHNFSVFPRRYRFWDRSFMCRCCGHVFQLASTSV